MTPADHAKLVLSRLSVMDLTELDAEDITRNSENFDGLALVNAGRLSDFFTAARVQSGESIYEVRLFETWMYCECPKFFYHKEGRGCHHAVFAFSQIDPQSYHRIIDQEKFDASFKKIRGAVYAPVERVLEKKGGIPL